MNIAERANEVIAERVEEDLAVDATYTQTGESVGTEVRVSIAAAAARTSRPAGAPGPVAGGSQATHEGAAWRITVRAMASGDTPTLGVGSLGGIERLRAGDTFLVPGKAVNRPESAHVKLRVVGDGRYGPGGERSGFWTAGGTL